MPADVGHTIADGEGSQIIAIIESFPADAGHIIRDSDRSQATAARERIVADAGHIIRAQKAPSPMPVTLSGMLMEVRLLQ